MSDEQFHNQVSRELGSINTTLVGFKESIDGLRDQVKIANGRTGKIEQEVNDLKEWKNEVKPMTDGMNVMNGLKSLAKWFGIPFIAVIGWIIAKAKGLI